MACGRIGMLDTVLTGSQAQDRPDRAHYGSAVDERTAGGGDPRAEGALFALARLLAEIAVGAEVRAMATDSDDASSTSDRRPR